LKSSGVSSQAERNSTRNHKARRAQRKNSFSSRRLWLTRWRLSNYLGNWTQFDPSWNPPSILPQRTSEEPSTCSSRWKPTRKSSCIEILNIAWRWTRLGRSTQPPRKLWSRHRRSSQLHRRSWIPPGHRLLTRVAAHTSRVVGQRLGGLARLRPPRSS